MRAVSSEQVLNKVKPDAWVAFDVWPGKAPQFLEAAAKVCTAAFST